MENNKIKPITLEIDEIAWNQFKEITPRSTTLNNKIVGLILQEIKRKNETKI